MNYTTVHLKGGQNDFKKVWNGISAIEEIIEDPVEPPSFATKATAADNAPVGDIVVDDEASPDACSEARASADDRNRKEREGAATCHGRVHGQGFDGYGSDVGNPHTPLFYTLRSPSMSS